MAKTRYLKIVVFDDLSEILLELPGNRSASEMIAKIRVDGGLWVGNRYIPWHGITEMWYEER
ncbi:hypothetical protein J2P12_00130 [Candidatus Bathyarchaeota archaeon]|nr:hypothetical protein [Candidatus Bathyarchaeota archaeon]